MTEAQWLEGRDLEGMLRYATGWAGDRKLRLFAVACCRYVASELAAPASRRAVEVAERYADRQADRNELYEARTKAWALGMKREHARRDAGDLPITLHPVFLAAYAAEERVENVAVKLAQNLANSGADVRREAARLLHEVLGNPFRAGRVDPAWLEWHDGAAVEVARSIYEERRLGDVPVLADALEEAGCTDAAILDHCRGSGPHVRGCWVVDVLLGRQ